METYLQGLSWIHKTNGPPHLPSRILKVYRKILVELRHRQCPDGLTVTLSTASLNSVPPAGTVGRVAIPGSGEG